MRLWLLTILLLCPIAAAHDDRALASASHELDAGQSVTWTEEVHWHRLMGTIRSDAPVTLEITGPAGSQTIASGASLRINHLVTCCHDAVWTEHTFTLTNIGETPTRATVDLALLHDNLAVLAYDSEPGGWWQTLIIVGLLIGIPAWRARQPHIDGDAALWLRRSRIAHAATWGVAIILAVVGMVRFGGGPLTGSLGATQPFPWGVAGFLNTHSLVMLGFMAGWGAAVALWAGARRRAGSPRAHALDGWLFAGGALLVGVILGVETGLWPIPLALGMLPALAIVLDMRWPSSHRPPPPLRSRL